MGNVYKYNMPSGIPGAISRVGGGVILNVEPAVLSSAAPLPFYGLAGAYNAADGKFRLLTAADTAATISGFLSRPFPQNSTTATGFFGSVALGTAGVPPQAGGEGAVLRAGYMTVQLQPNNAGVYTAVQKGMPVYICIQNPNAAGQVGGCQGAADGGNTVLLANAQFTGPADSDNNVEIEYNVGKN